MIIKVLAGTRRDDAGSTKVWAVELQTHTTEQGQADLHEPPCWSD